MSGREMKLFVLAAALLIGLVAASVASAKAPQPQLSHIGSQFVGNPITLECLPLRYYGDASFEDQDVHLDSYFCGPLRLLAGGVERYPARQGVGLIAMAHELNHLVGFTSEAMTECFAWQQTDDLARLFGARERYIPTLMRYATRDHLALTRVNPAYGDSTRCRAGGAWDLSPGDSKWP